VAVATAGLIWIATAYVATTLDLIRFGGHFPKGGYDVHHGRDKKPAAPPAVH
jgi:hypothetical protein